MEAAALQRPAPKQSGHGEGIVVVKLGGSVVRARQLAGWLDVIAGARSPIVVVPGGGALADEVRICQRDLGFDDAAAHRMALLAMDQLAWAVAGVRLGFEVGCTETALRGILARDHVAVWAPYTLIAGRTDLEESWRLTSDSLALWLAGKLGARACYVIKSIAASTGSRTAVALASEGVLDAAFPGMLAEIGVPAVMFGQGNQHALAQKLADFTAPTGLFIE